MLSFDVLVLRPLPASPVSLAELYCKVAGKNDGAWLRLQNDGSVVATISSVPQPLPTVDPSLGWTHLTLEASFDGTPTATITVGEQPSRSYPILDCRAGDLYEVNVGLSSNYGDKLSARYDNIVLKVAP
jgi:hypothetical protein